MNRRLPTPESVVAIVVFAMTITACGTSTPTTRTRVETPEIRVARNALEAPVAPEVGTNDLPAPLREAAELRKNGDLHTASAALRDWMLHSPNDVHNGLACTLLGLIEFELVRYVEADRVLSGCRPPETLDDLVAWLLGEVRRGLGRPDAARHQFERVADMRHSPLSPGARFRVADSLFEAERYREALATYERMLDTFPEYPEAPTVRYRMAVCARELGHHAEAAKAFYRIARYAPVHDAGIASTRALESLGRVGVAPPKQSFADQLAWGDALRRERRWPEALAVFEALKPLATEKRQRGRLAELLARTLESLDRYEEAYAELGITRKNGGWVGDVRSMRIRLLRKLGKTEQAVKLATRRGSKRVRGLKAAEIYYEDGRYKLAQKLYARHLKPGRDASKLWLQAWVDYRAGLHARARRGFAKLLNNKGIRAHKARYWLARAQQEGGLDSLAKKTFKQVAEYDSRGYYGIQAANRLLDMGETELYQELTGTPDEHVTPVELREASGGQVRWQGGDGSDLPPPAPRARRSEVIGSLAREVGGVFPELWRAYDRYRLGLDEDARRELRIARGEFDRARSGSPKRLADQPTSLYVDSRARRRGLWGSSLRRSLKLPKSEKKREEDRLRAIRALPKSVRRQLSQALADIGDPYYGRRLAYRSHGRTLKRLPTPDSNEVFKAAYPMVFESVLREETGRYGVPPYLMTAVARVESAFNELAVSTAGARGLLQVMPVTGRLIAQRRGDWEFAPSELLDPEVSLSYGTWYMNQLLKKFHGQEPLAISGYNAGPHRVHKWLARRGAQSDLDEFIEEVPYTQARRYVKSVLRYIALYRRIYSGRSDTYVGQNLNADFGDNINW